MSILGSMVRTLAATATFAVFHSVLASTRAKELAARLLGGAGPGRRRRDAFYRPFYNAQALVTSALLMRYISGLPDRDLYHVRGAPGVLMRAGQAVSLGCFAAAAWRVGPLRFLGAPALAAQLARRATVPPPMEAQGPVPRERGTDMDAASSFRLSRHPLNFFGVPLLWLNPKMTAKLATFAAAASVYFYVGSIHEESRLLARYGEAYRRYVRSGVPFFFPGPGQPLARIRPTHRSGV